MKCSRDRHAAAQLNYMLSVPSLVFVLVLLSSCMCARDV